MVEFPKYLDRWDVVLVLVLVLLYQNLSCCWSLNDEGFALLKFKETVLTDPFGALANWNDDVGVVNPCSWNGIECSAGYVVSLNLKDLCLGGFIASDLGNLIHIKSIILRNNSFSGSIPENIAKLKELEVLDLGYNNLSGSLPPDLGSNLSLAILLLDHNGVFNCLSPEIYELQRLSEAQVDESLLYRGTKMPYCYGKVYTRNAAESRDVTQRKLLKLTESPRNVTRPRNVTINVARPRNVTMPRQVQAPPFPPPSASPPAPPTSVSSSPDPPQNPHKSGGRIHVLVLVLTIGGSALLLCLVTGFIFCRSSKVAVVKPWATGLSGQLQKAFVTGVPKLNRSELVTACEDFSNVIGTPSSGTLYKGTLSSGVEIATLSFPVESAKDWTKTKKIQFREKIETLSKLNHKNFVNLLGYCEEEEPFTRMMVFEYAPNGTLFEHLHIKEAEHLDWAMRMRILMGMAYCLQHMHQLSPPITHMKLNSSAVYLTEDYAAKVSDFWFWNELAADELDLDPQSNVYSFGVLIFEMVTGQLPFTVAGEDWASEYLGGGQPLKNLVDPTLNSFHEQQLERIEEIMKACVNPDRKRRPEMREITGRLREATAIEPDAAIPKLSPLWWAELEILSTEANN